MRYLLTILAVVAVAAWVGLRPDHALPGPDARVSVLTTAPILVSASSQPDAAEIVALAAEALRDRIAETSHPVLVEVLRAMADDTEGLRRIAGQSIGRLSTDAAALAFPSYRLMIVGDEVYLTSVTIEVVPGRRATAVSLRHEDGHATINDLIALRCGPGLAREALGRGGPLSAVRTEVVSELYRLGDLAHDFYHEAVNETRTDFDRQARRAAAAVTDTCLAS